MESEILQLIIHFFEIGSFKKNFYLKIKNELNKK